MDLFTLLLDPNIICLRTVMFKLQDIAGIHLNLDIPKWLHILHLDHLNSLAGICILEYLDSQFEDKYNF